MRFGAFIHACEVVGSTMDVARDLLRAGAPPGTVVTAEYQTAGRGRQGRVWHAPRGANVCLTTICEPVEPGAAWQVAQVAGIAAAAAIEDAAPSLRPTLKFPNDVLLGGRKVSGVLVEAVEAPEGGGTVVPLIGIGINVRNAGREMPPDIAALSTSLEAATGAPFAVPYVQSVLLRRLTDAWHRWRTDGFAALLPEWRRLADPDVRRVFILDGAPVPCRVLDLAADGTVTLELPDGSRRTVHAAQALFE